MELVQEITNQYILYIPIALVIVGAILVFTFGFKSAEQPPFEKFTLDDRKSGGKKRKIKEKKPTANGHVTSDLKSDKSPSKESKKSPQKESVDVKKEKKQNEKPKKQENKSRLIEEIRGKNKVSEKPVDFDDGNWETVPLKADKKKKDQSPAKKDKKISKKEKDAKAEKAELEKLAKEVVNKNLREKEKERQIIEEAKVEAIKIEQVEETKDKKKKEKKPKKEEKPVDEVKEEEPPKKEIKKEVKEVAAPPKPVVVPEKIEEPVKDVSPQKVAPAFDELGDTWTESKATKKTSKKKARREN